MDGAEQPFKAYWANTVHPAIKDDYERLLSTTPKRICEREAIRGSIPDSTLNPSGTVFFLSRGGPIWGTLKL